MKRLYIIRHAKAVKSVITHVDFDRPLEARGNKDAQRMAAYCKDNLDTPKLMISSAAVRTMETMQHFEKEFPNAQVITSPDLYHASAGIIRNAIEKADNKADVLYIFGHNPGMWELVNSLVRGNNDFPTCAVAIFQADTDSWGRFFTSKPELVEFLTPGII